MLRTFMDNSPVVRQNASDFFFMPLFTQLIQTRFAKIQMLELWGLRAAHCKCNKPCTGRIWLPEMTQMRQNNHAIGRNRRICAPGGGNALSNFIKFTLSQRLQVHFLYQRLNEHAGFLAFDIGPTPTILANWVLEDPTHTSIISMYSGLPCQARWSSSAVHCPFFREGALDVGASPASQK
jgi:hypothetical protein